ncbi:hypothetical protein [Granulosicoccus antarcticus]|uniref:Uncharacterized protein n=1 Tax=Granulosicoccus antarcticus IMCC3135 TaxID=1192854 RepID=A0A2Z2NPG4_9GAMM|nr:hypothetical protein [Granulosicoccus antarcticus]ASJ70670.1 hypothetical protein IMCC3135_02785 [Granulosicoccus antarcticus IMCC3135]
MVIKKTELYSSLWASCDDIVALKGDREIGDKVNKIISALAEENDLEGIIDLAHFNDEESRHEEC